MNRSHRLGWVDLGLLLGFVLQGGGASGQRVPPPQGMPVPRLFVALPSGGRAGTSVEVSVTGVDLDGPRGLLFSHPGITARPIAAEGPKVPAARAKAQRAGIRGRGVPLETQRFQVNISTDVPIGTHDVRLVNGWGVSNPRAFVVGDLAEVLEREPNDDVDEAQRVAPETTIHGAIGSPTDVDDFVIAGKEGRRVLVSGLTSSIDSRLLLALELRDAAGKLLATNHEYRGNDALLDVELPADGDYLLRAFAFTYTRGDAEHFYRISVATAPWIDAVFPPAIEPGKSAEVTVYGRNLPGGRLDPSARVEGRVLETLKTTVKAPDDPQILAYRGHLPPSAAGLEGFEFRLKNEAGTSNPFWMTLAKGPVVQDRGRNDTSETAQPVAPPCEIAGRIEARRDRDWYAFEARKGDDLSIEAYGERIGAPLDLYFALRDARTKQILGEFDDGNEPTDRGQIRGQFSTRTGDPARFRFLAPSDGRYELMVSSREAPNQASPRHLYRVRITPEQPDFRLILMPASPNYPDGCVLGRGGEAEATVFVLRQDGFRDAITLDADGLPEGVACPPQVIGTDQRRGTLVLSATADAPTWSGTVRVEGTATIGGKPVVREARAATITWPVPQGANIPAVTRLDQGFALAVRDKPPFRLQAGVGELAVTQGEKAGVPLTLTALAADQKGGLQNVTISVPIPNLAVSVALPQPGEARAQIAATTSTPPGVYSVVWRGQAQVPLSKDPNAGQKRNVPVVVSSTPVTLTVLPRELARVTIAPRNPSAKAGQTARVTVRVNRLFDYAGPFRVQVVLPADARGIQAAEGEIPAGQDEVDLSLEIDPAARPGTRGNLIARVTARFLDKHPIAQETRFNLDVIE